MFKNYKKIKTPIKGRGNYTLWVADTDDKKSQGLRGVRQLPKRFGMIFPYTSDVEHSFTMVGVRFPIYIIFLDKNFNILKTVKARPGERSISCGMKYRNVIEIPVY